MYLFCIFQVQFLVSKILIILCKNYDNKNVWTVMHQSCSATKRIYSSLKCSQDGSSTEPSGYTRYCVLIIMFQRENLGFKNSAKKWQKLKGSQSRSLGRYLDRCRRRIASGEQCCKTNFVVMQLPLNYGNILIHDMMCSVSFQVNIFSPAYKDLVISILVI